MGSVTTVDVQAIRLNIIIVHLLLLHREYGQKLIKLILEFFLAALFPHVQKSLVRLYICLGGEGVIGQRWKGLELLRNN